MNLCHSCFSRFINARGSDSARFHVVCIDFVAERRNIDQFGFDLDEQSRSVTAEQSAARFDGSTDPDTSWRENDDD